jgi:hypothetical protein
MRVHHIMLFITCVLMMIGCGQRQSATPQTTAKTNENQWFWDGVAKATQLESNADVVFAVEGAMAPHSVRLLRPSPAITNDLVSLSEFQSALTSVRGRESAVIEMYAYGFDTNRLTNAAAQLRQCGFRDIRAVTLGWGGRFVGPTL